ncbi:MAG: hypothetical protein ACRDV1_03265 [Actinomycetes bacterium]
MNHANTIRLLAADSACWMELDSAAAYAGVPVDDVRRAVSEQRLRAVRNHPMRPGTRLVHRRDVETWAEERVAS